MMLNKPDDNFTFDTNEIPEEIEEKGKLTKFKKWAEKNEWNLKDAIFFMQQK